jgi:hypothetical protein
MRPILFYEIGRRSGVLIGVGCIFEAYGGRDSYIINSFLSLHSQELID